jgi:co-chaperonin GroES (HSP10)
MNIKKIKPMFTSILVTKDIYTTDVKEGGLITRTSGTVKEYQKVIAVGESVRGIKVGDLVHIDPKKYAVKKYKEDSVKSDLMTNQIIGYDIPQVILEGRNYLLIDSSDVKYIIEDYEEDISSDIIKPKTDIII